MKELSIEEKAKRYDEALEIAKEINNEQQAQPFNVMTRVFPELQESEDERIKKSLAAYFAKFKPDDMWDADFSFGDIVAWLEKQGEQKPADKVESKFKQGEWITNGDYTWQIVSVTDLDYILQSQDGNIVDDTISYVDEQFHSFTIEDAKDGDVLTFNDGHGNDSIELIKSITDKKIEFWFCLTNSNRYEVFDGITPYTNLVSREDATPATKEQRDLLFQKIKEVGYVWDFENKKLKKEEVDNLHNYLYGEQNPAWSEEDEDYYDAIIEKLEVTQEDALLTDNQIKFLKSLKERYTWKPSDEQLNNILDVLSFDNCTPKRRKFLESLYEQLKKLREE